MRGVAQSGGEEQFVLHFDGVGALLRFLVYLAESGQLLSKLMEEAEQYFITSDKVYCLSLIHISFSSLHRQFGI